MYIVTLSCPRGNPYDKKTNIMNFLLTATVVLFTAVSCFAQLNQQALNSVKADSAYSNIYVKKMYSDANSSVFVIFIKQAVRKHLHSYHTEVVTVLEGRGEFYLDGERIDIKAGDQIIIPPNTPHAVITRSKKPLKVISIQSPEFLGKDRFFLED
jgi:quercetin dioxygenase-like cupin family protein